MDVDGYPLNISYHGGVGMEQEASWVGLGWSLNAGSINRGMRGLPDDFNGGSDIIDESIKILPNKTYGLGVGGGIEIVGFDILSLGLSAGLGIQYNNYKGLGFELDFGVTGGVSATSMAGGASLNGGLGLSVSNQDGANFSMSGGLGVQAGGGDENYGGSATLGVNRTQNRGSRSGLVADIISGSAGISTSAYGAGGGISSGSGVNLIPNTAYTPNMKYPTTFSGITGEIHTGGELYWCNFYGYWKAFKFEQGLNGNNFKKLGYGYLNLENADWNSLTDFNRDMDGTYHLECPKLPFANLTYDVFNANAQGLNELFRPYRNDFGYVSDPITIGGGTASDIGLEMNYGNLLEVGFNKFGITTNDIATTWYNNNNALVNVGFKGENQLTNDGVSGSYRTYEHAYFKSVDEMHTQDISFDNSILGTDLAKFELDKYAGTVNSKLKSTIVSSSGSSSYGGQKKTNREPRNNNLTFLNITDASNFAVDKLITDYTTNTFSYTANGDIDKTKYTSTARNTGLSGKDHHISEITVTKDDGARYVYGVPVYNKTQKEVVFNCSSPSLSVGGDQLVSYAAGTDNSIGNTLGKDNFYMGRTLPAYAHSYLLTTLLSKDYVDITGDGPTTDDYGDYTKFNYSKTSTGYSWRNPIAINKAIYDYGKKATTDDDKGVYVYGEKDLWYIHSIETKNYVAEFHTESRDDAHGVNGPDGGTSTSSNNSTKRLKKIVLYSKKDLATPIKTANFAYNYSLCPGTPNSVASGKLTLEKVYFTYGKSDKGVFSPYTFTYSSHNPSYNRTEVDRWGSYQVTTGSLDSRDFPYTQQDKTTADYNAEAWALTSIMTPAKSQINIDYEADDYSYIQNQAPAQMLMLKGFNQTQPSASSDPLGYTSADLYSSSSPYTPNNYIVVDLTKMKDGGLITSSVTSVANYIFKTQMLPATGKLFFKGFVQLGSGSVTQDFVPGYSEFETANCGLFIHANATSTLSAAPGKLLYKYAYIKLKDVDIEDSKNYAGDNCNPFSKAAWQITRSEYPHIAYPGSEPGGSGLTAMLGLVSAMTEVFTFKQKNGRLRKKLYSRNCTPSKSFVRLNLPSKSKFGGGHRVSKIEILDNWSNMVSGEKSSTYGQTYDYTMNAGTEIISSGVASYEPLTGGDEISLRNPVEYSVARIEAPDDAHFFEYPIGEAFFPSPTVIYSKVTVRNIEQYLPSTTTKATGNIGRTEYEFFTSKDFPIYSAYDNLESEVHMPKPSIKIFSSYQESSVHLSQGFILKLNNMHGKLKSIRTFQEGNSEPISGVIYKYRTTAGGNLDNTISVIDETGTISNKVIGQHIEAVADFRQQNTTTFGNSISGNLNISLLPLGPFQIPIPIPSVFWHNSTETRDFYSATLTKVVTQNGILETVETISNYAKSETKNLVWDSKTSDVVLSKTSTNFRDYNYDYQTPAHWAYAGMAAAYKNVGYGFKNAVAPATGIITVPTGASGLIQPGDEVQLIYTNGSDVKTGVYSDRLWVNKNGSNLELINRDGLLCCTTAGPNNINVFTGSSNTVLKVIRSGYRNILDETVEAVSFSGDPRSGSAISFTANILDASAQEFSEDWQKLCQGPDDGCSAIDNTCFASMPAIYSNTNPYIRNTKGNWNGKRNYTFLDTRLASASTGTMDIRKDGTFNTYKPFFKYESSSWHEVYNPGRTSDYSSSSPFDKWILNSEITKITPYGNIVEAKDAINRFSSSLFAYNHTLKTATAVNARHRDIGFDNFEDYGYGLPCMENHFGFRKYKAGLANGIAHTGRYSLKITPVGCASTVRNVTESDCETNYGYNNDMAPLPTPSVTNDCSCISSWSPVSNKSQTYLLSVWVKESQLNAAGTFTNAVAEVFEITPSPVNIATLVNKSPIINGWQKLDYEFTIPSKPSGTPYVIALYNNSSTNDAYFDDIRVQPVTASMNTYVYDPKSLKIWSELDDRNFATIYEYDTEGALVRVKKETEKGIQTIKETRNSFKKQ